MNKEELLPLVFINLGSKYLTLSRLVFEETIKQGNAHMLVFDQEPVEEKSDELTKWSDFRIIEPSLFSFYHGLELVMKGLLFLSKTSLVANHNLETFFKNIDSDKKVPDSIKTILRSHILSANLHPFIGLFLTQNKISVSDLYESLRYPSDKTFKTFINYIYLHYHENAYLEYFKKIVSDSKNLSRQALILYSYPI